MIVVLPYCLRDQEITLKLLKWIQELGGCHNHDLLLCRDARCPENYVQPILSTARASFKSVKDLIAKAEIDGWPEGANYFFRLCASEISHMRGVRYFFWMEPDAIPLKEGWLDQLDAEFIRCKKPFMGDRVQVENIPLHMSGIGFYPSPLHEYAGEAYRAFDLAFDMAGRDQIVPQAHFTNLIEHAWKHPSFTEDSELDTQISKEAVIFHASKDGSLISLLRGRKSPPVQPLEPSPAKESVSLSMDSPSSNSLSGGVESRHALVLSAHGRGTRGTPEKNGSGSSAPPAQIISCDIFIRTYPGDYQWLTYCLKSIEKFATGFRKVWVVSPEDIPFSAVSSVFQWKVMNEECDDHYLSQQIHKLYADVSTDYQADHILHIDSDTVFTRPVTPDDFLKSGKVVWPYTPYDKIETPWQPITEKFMCRPVANEFMRRFPIMVPRWLYPKLREFCYHWHKVTIGDYVKRQPLRAFSEFNALGAYAFEYHYNKFEWVNTIEETLPEPFARQFHSWGGLTPEVEQELEQIFSGKIEPEENSGRQTNEVGTASLNIPAETLSSQLLERPKSVVDVDQPLKVGFDSRPAQANVPQGIKELQNGIWIIKDDTHIGKWVEQQGRLDHDMNTLPFILSLIKDGDAVVDAGAFIGDHTIAYSKAVGSKGIVYAFEPNPIAYQCLQHNMKACDNVIMDDVGLGDKSESIPLSGNNHNYGGCYAGTHMKIADVSVVTLDQLFNDEWVNFIKLDIEGYEPKALQGMVKTIERCHPKMVIEINQIALERQNCFPSKIFNFLKGHDYEWKILQDNCDEDSPMYDILATPVPSTKKLAPALPQNGINEQGLLLTHQQDHDPITEIIHAVAILKKFTEVDSTNRQRVMMRLSKANLIPRNTKKYGKKKKNKMAERTSSMV